MKVVLMSLMSFVSDSTVLLYFISHFYDMGFYIGHNNYNNQVFLSQASWDRRVSMEMKPYGKLLGRNPLSDAPYRNPGMVLNGQGPGHHPLGGAPYLDLDTVLSEQGSGSRILSDALHRRSGVVKMSKGLRI
jgi:hypothetical protein